MSNYVNVEKNKHIKSVRILKLFVLRVKDCIRVKAHKKKVNLRCDHKNLKSG